MSGRRARIAGLVVVAALVALGLWWSATGEHNGPAVEAQGNAGTGALLRAVASERRADIAALTSDAETWATMGGQVVAADGSPIPGAMACAGGLPAPPWDAEPSRPHCVKTGASGAFRINHLRPGRDRVTASAPGFLAAVEPRSDEPALRLRAGDARSGVILRLEPGGVTVHGRVFDIGGGPIEGAWVSVSSPRARGPGKASARSAADGSFSVQCTPGKIWVTARADGYAKNETSGDAPCGTLEILLTYPRVGVAWTRGRGNKSKAGAESSGPRAHQRALEQRSRPRHCRC